MFLRIVILVATWFAVIASIMTDGLVLQVKVMICIASFATVLVLGLGLVQDTKARTEGENWFFLILLLLLGYVFWPTGWGPWIWVGALLIIAIVRVVWCYLQRNSDPYEE